jgi:HAD superfamily hydrolase (TIGR01509 family)
MKTKIEAILFDIDGTLFDRNLAQAKILQIIVDSLPEVFVALDIKRVAKAFSESDRLTTAEFDSGMPSEGLRGRRSRLFLRLLGIPESHADIITEIYVQDYPSVCAPVPNAVTVVEELSKEYQIGAVSNGMPDVQYRKLESMDLRHLFSCIVLSEEVGIRKPDPRIFLRAAQLLGRQPAECLFVGDSYTSDIVGAKKAGMYTCWFNRTNASLPANEIKPDYVVRDLLEILGLLK